MNGGIYCEKNQKLTYLYAGNSFGYDNGCWLSEAVVGRLVKGNQGHKIRF